jgi:two-component system, OmpR family, phosphate regulon response regulator PhoB
MKRALMRKVLLVQGGLGDSVGPALEQNGYAVTWVRTAKSAAEWLEKEKPGLVVVDVPSLRVNLDRLCAGIKRVYGLPILAIEGEDDDPLNGALTGIVDAVIARPLQMRKLLTRVEKLLPEATGPELRAGDLVFYPSVGRLRRRSEEYYLNPKLSKLLLLFMTRPGELISRKTLMMEIWETTFMGDTRTLDVHIRWLREKIEDEPNDPKMLRTVRGQGYMFESGKPAPARK